MPVGTNSDTFFSAALVDSDDVLCSVMNNSGCAAGLMYSSNSITVTVIELPIVSFQGNPLIITDPADTVFFTDNSTNATSWEWSFGDSLSGNNSSSQQNSWHHYNNDGLYSVTLSVSNAFGCSDSLTIPDYILINLDTGNVGMRVTNYKDNYAFVIYPNPTTAYINVLAYLSDKESVELRLLNMQGKEILRRTLNFSKSNSGEYRLDLRTNELRDGLYFIDLIYKRKHYINKVVIGSQY